MKFEIFDVIEDHLQESLITYNRKKKLDVEWLKDRDIIISKLRKKGLIEETQTIAIVWNDANFGGVFVQDSKLVFEESLEKSETIKLQDKTVSIRRRTLEEIENKDKKSLFGSYRFDVEEWINYKRLKVIDSL